MYEIKPLEWEPFMDGACAEARPISGHRYVATGWSWCYQLSNVHGDIAGDKCATLDAAKAACEADWRGRVAACLVDRSGELAAVVEAAERYAATGNLKATERHFLEPAIERCKAALAALEGKQ